MFTARTQSMPSTNIRPSATSGAGPRPCRLGISRSVSRNQSIASGPCSQRVVGAQRCWPRRRTGASSRRRRPAARASDCRIAPGRPRHSDAAVRTLERVPTLVPAPPRPRRHAAAGHDQIGKVVGIRHGGGIGLVHRDPHAVQPGGVEHLPGGRRPGPDPRRRRRSAASSAGRVPGPAARRRRPDPGSSPRVTPLRCDDLVRGLGKRRFAARGSGRRGCEFRPAVPRRCRNSRCVRGPC